MLKRVHQYVTHYLLLASSLLALAGPIQAEEVTVNFRDAEIDSVVESIAELTGGTFIIDPRVKGKMTIVSPDPVEVELLYQIFLSALQVHGFQGVDDGAAVRIVPLSRSVNVPIDGPAGNELTTQVITLRYIAANEVVPILKPLMSQGAHLGAHPASNKIVMTDTKAQVRRLKGILNNMDNSDTKGFEVITLNHTSAGDLVSIAREMGILTGQSKVVEDTGANRIIVSGPRSTREQLRKLIDSLDTESSDNSGIDVIYLNYADAETIQPVLENMLKSKAFLKLSGEGATKQDANAYTIQADKENNALIIAAPTGVTTAIKSIISKLDKPRSQVLIEAVIAEVSEDFTKNISTNLAAAGPYGAILSDFSGTLTSAIGAAVTNNSSNGISAEAVQSLAGVDPTFGGGYINEEHNWGIAGIIQAIKGDSRSNLLSTPSILTLENEEALISIGQEVPFETGSFTTTSGGANNPFRTVEREEVGTILRVKPQINEGDGVRLEVNQEVSNVSAITDRGITTDQKVIETNVIVNDNDILVLGGLIDNNFTTSERRTPLLGDIPLLGRLFRESRRGTDSTMLMVFIRPTIIRSPEQARKLTESKYRLLQGYQAEFLEENKLQKHVDELPEQFQRIESLDQMVFPETIPALEEEATE